MAGYQSGDRKVTVTADGQAVTWIVDYDHKTVTVVVNGLSLGTFGNRSAAIGVLGLVVKPAK